MNNLIYFSLYPFFYMPPAVIFELEDQKCLTSTGSLSTINFFIYKKRGSRKLDPPRGIQELLHVFLPAHKNKRSDVYSRY